MHTHTNKGIHIITKACMHACTHTIRALSERDHVERKADMHAHANTHPCRACVRELSHHHYSTPASCSSLQSDQMIRGPKDEADYNHTVHCINPAHQGIPSLTHKISVNKCPIGTINIKRYTHLKTIRFQITYYKLH